MMRHLATRLAPAMAATLLLCAPPLATRGAEGPADFPPVRVRLEWSGRVPHAWGGLIEVSAGRLDRPVSLGLEADDPGTLWTDDGAIWLRRRTPRLDDGCDFDVSAPAEAVISIDLQSPRHKHVRLSLEAKLADLRDGATIRSADGHDAGRLVVRRAPGDTVRLEIDRPHLVFDPGEPFIAVASLAERRAEAGAALCWELAVARGGEVLARGKAPIDRKSPAASSSSVAVPLRIPLPHEEGAYDVRLRVGEGGRGRPDRVVQVLVLAGRDDGGERPSPLPPAAPDLREEQVVDAFDLHGEVARAAVELRAALRPSAAPFDRFGGWASDGDATAPTESPGPRADSEETQTWTAYRLRIERPGTPHRLAVFFPQDAPQHVGIGVMEPNAAGRLAPIGIDSGLSIRAASRSDGEGEVELRPPLKHEVLFWPRVVDPVVHLYSLDGGGPVRAKRVEVRTAALDRRPDERFDEPVEKQRLVGAYLRRPLLPERFGATKALDPASGRGFDDWETFRSAAERLAACLHEAGCNGLMLGALADGGTIHPSRLLQPTLRYDTGALFSTGQDPMRKDVLELLFRIFDREGLALVPELRFSTPLPALERALERGGPPAAGIELIGKDGRSWREARAAIGGLAPHYNPLDPAVQEAALAVVDEILERYRGHRSFRGLAVELSSDGWLQLPGLDWGLDDSTIARFETDTGIRVPTGDGAERFSARHAYLTQDARQEWIRWRCARLAAFHRRIAERVAQALPDGQCIFSGNRILQGTSPDDNLLEAVVSGAKVQDLLAGKGLDFGLYRDFAQTTLLRPAIRSGSSAPHRRSLDHTINESPDFDAAFAGTSVGALFHHAAQERRLPEFDAGPPGQPALPGRAVREVPSGAENRRRFAHALAAGDRGMFFDEGWMVPLGRQHALRETRAALRRIPPVPFHKLAGKEAQPAVVRFARHAEKTYFYVANDSPWQIDVSLTLAVQPDRAVRSLKDGATLPLVVEGAAPATARVPLEGWDVAAFAIDDPAARVERVAVIVPPAELEALHERIRQLDQRIAAVHRQPQPVRPELPNAGFEAALPERDALPGWEFPAQGGAAWALDDAGPRSGSSSLMLASGNQRAAVVSSGFPVQSSRTAVVGVWMRSDRPGALVRLSWEAEADTGTAIRFADVEAGIEWRQYRLRVEDIPPHAWRTARFRVELRDPGKLWLDDVDLELHRFERNDLRQLTKTFAAVMLAWEERRYADCHRLLDGYWGQVLFFEP